MTDTSSQAWRDECLARHICALPGIEDRRRFMNGFQLRNGKAAADRIGELVKQEWAKRLKK